MSDEPSNKDDASPPKTDPRLARAARSIALLARVFEQVARDSGVSLPQYRLLAFLRDGPKRAGELAARAAIKRPTLTALVDTLEKEERLQRIADECDGRGVQAEITEKGHDDLEAVESALCAVVEELCRLGNYEEMLNMIDHLSERVEVEVERRLKKVE